MEQVEIRNDHFVSTGSMAVYALVSILAFFVAQSTTGQMLYNPNDERFKSLYLEKVQSDYKVQKEEFNRQEMLHGKGLISEKEFNESEGRFKSAQITYKQAILSLAFEQPHLTIEKAIKYQSRDGKKRVRLSLRNTTGGLIQGKKVQLEDFEGVRTDQISNVYISLLDAQHSIISQPYEAKIMSMPQNQLIAVDFFMLRDLDNVTVRCVFGDKSEEKTIFLQKDESANRVLLTSAQFSQEADLGTRATYDLTLELFSSADNVYKLALLNLPPQVSYDFLDAQTPTAAGARLSQVKFSQDVNTRKLVLAVYLPDRYDSSSFLIDQPLMFFATAVPQSEAGKIPEKIYSTTDLDRMNISYLRLELVPRGIGRIQVRATNFYQERKPGENVQMSLVIYNDGTRRLDNIKVHAEVPMNWTATIIPDLLSTLLPGKEGTVSVSIVPAADVNVGDYEATVKTESFANTRRVESEDKKIRIHITSSANVFGTSLLVLLLAGVVVSVVIFGVKLSRK